MHRGGIGLIKYVAFALAIVVALPACAGDWDWDMRSGSPTAGRGRVAYYHRHHHRPRVLAYERRSVERAERQDDDGGKCVDKVRGLGTQWIGTKGALEAAKKDWMERVRYDHGESYVDMTNAKDFESRCGRVSIGEVAGQVTYRCEIVARPCKAPLKEANKSHKE
jgi:hypothetical protein